MGSKTADVRRRLPAMGVLLDSPMLQELCQVYGRDLVRAAAESELALLRERMREPGVDAALIEGAVEALPSTISRSVERQVGMPLRRVINATGICVHTNLGRSPLPGVVAERVASLLQAYTDLEIDLETGTRGDRNRTVEGPLKALTGAPAALVVNNNAAALVLVLASLARDREVIVARSELVEIGGSFRIPTILEAAGTRLREVGAANRVRLADYEQAIGEHTALVLKVFPSNYRMSGFVSSVGVPALVELCERRGLPLLVDEGSGLLRPPSPGRTQLRDHLSMRELVELGCPLICGSGDKLLGGPQAGLLVGDEELVRRCQRHPLYRALRPDRSCIVALGEVLRRHLAGDPLPIDRLWDDSAELEARLTRLADRLGAEIVESDAFIGGGAAPEAAVPGRALALPADDELAGRLRLGDPAVMVFQPLVRIREELAQGFDEHGLAFQRDQPLHPIRMNTQSDEVVGAVQDPSAVSGQGMPGFHDPPGRRRGRADEFGGTDVVWLDQQVPAA